ncbi:hypothetical protein ACFQVA_18535 [Actinomadura keratinilytica]
MAATRRITVGVVTAAVCAAGLAGCGTERGTGDGQQPGGQASPAPAPENAVRLIGDGSTAHTGAQPHQPRPQRLKPGQKPPQFVVFSWDGAGEDSQKLFSHFRKVGKANNATMTYFLSGVYLLPEELKEKYEAPQHGPGRSDIGFNDREGIADTVREVRGAWLEGNEIGTHFNGHFCGPEGGVGTWSVGEWKSEIAQAKSFVKTWKSHSGLKDAAPLPFDYDKELIGARTPASKARRTSSAPPPTSASATTPAVSATRSGPARRRGCGTSRSSSCRCRGATSRRSPWTTTSWSTSPGPPPRATRPCTTPGATSSATASSRRTTAPTRATARR